MTRKHLFLILLLVVSLFTLGACGSDDDSGDNNRPDFQSSSSGDTSSTSGMTSSGDASSSGMTSSGDASSSGMTSSGDASSGMTSSGDASSSGVDTSSSGVDTSSSGGETCNDPPTYTGQIGIPPVPEAGSHEGGVYSNTAYDAAYDSGIAAALTALDEAIAADGNPMFPFIADVDVDITEATVTATSYNDRGNRVFWLADGQGAVQVFFDQEATANFPPFTIKVGQKLSMKVTQMQMNFDAPSIVAVDATVGWTADDEAAGNNEVYVSEHFDGPALTTDQLHEMVRVKGTLTTANGPCGGSSNCFDLAYAGGAETVEFRTSSTFVEVGDCVTFVGPAGAFRGAPQLNVDNFDFYWEIEPGN